MKKNIGLLMFALFLSVMTMAKQTFALDNFSIEAHPGEDSVTAMTVLVNEYRQEAGLSPYVLNDSLSKAAQRVADNMAATEFTSHYDSEGASPAKRAVQAGYSDHVTEIIYGGFGGSVAAWEWWTSNETHISLILSEDYHEFGVGMAVGAESGRTYWAIMFGTGTPTSVAAGRPTLSAPGMVTKLPVTEETAVPSPAPTFISNANDTLANTTFVTVTGFTDEAITLATSQTATGSADASGTTTGAATPSPTETANDSPWLIVGAAFIILVGIILFYFPRLGWTRP